MQISATECEVLISNRSRQLDVVYLLLLNLFLDFLQKIIFILDFRK